MTDALVGLPEPVVRLLDAGSARLAEFPDDRDGMRFAMASVSDQPVLVGCVDSRRAAGTLALPHFADLVALLDAALVADLPVLLFLDTAGVRLQDAASGELGFRHALFAACAFKARGGRGVSIIPGPMGCFGAGALLALCLGPVLMDQSSKLAVAGPKALEAAAGKDIFDAGNPASVQSLMGANARLQGGLVTQILSEEASMARLEIANALTDNALKLLSAGSLWRPTTFHVLPDGQRVPMQDGVIFGEIDIDGSPVDIAGVTPGTILTVERAATIANLLKPERQATLCLLCDAEQSLDPAEDSRGLALAYASLARTVTACRLSGRSVIAYGETGGTGAAFMVLGMMAEKIALKSDAECSAVPLDVAKALLGANYSRANASAAELFSIGGIEILHDFGLANWPETMARLIAQKPREPSSFKEIHRSSSKIIKSICRQL